MEHWDEQRGPWWASATQELRLRSIALLAAEVPLGEKGGVKRRGRDEPQIWLQRLLFMLFMVKNQHVDSSSMP